MTNNFNYTKLVTLDKGEIPPNMVLYALKTFSGAWYLESPDDQAQTDKEPQICALRVFETYREADLYENAVSPFMGRMTVHKTTTTEIESEMWRITNFSRGRFEAPTDVIFSAIAPYEWPVSIGILVEHKKEA